MTAKSKSKAESQAVRTRSKLSDLCLSILRDHPYSKSLCEPRRKVCILKMAKISKGHSSEKSTESVIIKSWLYWL